MTGMEVAIEARHLALKAARVEHEHSPHLVTKSIVEQYEQELNELLDKYPARSRHGRNN